MSNSCKVLCKISLKIIFQNPFSKIQPVVDQESSTSTDFKETSSKSKGDHEGMFVAAASCSIPSGGYRLSPIRKTCGGFLNSINVSDWESVSLLAGLQTAMYVIV